MAEPRFKKDMEGKTKKKSSECPGKEQYCKDCKGANIISPETLLRKEPEEQSGAEAIAPLFKGSKPEPEESPCAGSACAFCNECD